MTQEVPFSNISNNYLVMVAIMQYRLPEPPQLYESWPHKLRKTWDICRLCWTRDPKERILISNVVDWLKDIMDTAERAMETKIPQSMPRRVKPEFSFHHLLAKLKDFDLTRNVCLKSSLMSAHGQYADVFEGIATLVEPSGVREVKVAVKQPRAHARGDFANVCGPLIS